MTHEKHNHIHAVPHTCDGTVTTDLPRHMLNTQRVTTNTKLHDPRWAFCNTTDCIMIKKKYHFTIQSYTRATSHAPTARKHPPTYPVTRLRAVCTTYSDPDEPRISNKIPVRCITIFQRSLHAQPHAHNTPAPRKVLHSVYNNTHSYLSGKYTTRHDKHQITRSAPFFLQTASVILHYNRLHTDKKNITSL